MKLCEFYQNIRCETGISDFQFLNLDSVPLLNLEKEIKIIPFKQIWSLRVAK